MFLQDTVTVCGACRPPDDAELLELRTAYAHKCLGAKAYEAAAVQFLLAGRSKEAAMALSRSGAASALVVGSQLCLLASDSRAAQQVGKG